MLSDQLKVENRIKEGAENLLQMPLNVSLVSIIIARDRGIRCRCVSSGRRRSRPCRRVYMAA